MINPDYLTIPRPADPLDAASRYFGSDAELALQLGYTPSAVAMWRHRGRVPTRAARAIEDATRGQVPAYLFGHQHRA